MELFFWERAPNLIKIVACLTGIPGINYNFIEPGEIKDYFIVSANRMGCGSAFIGRNGNNNIEK